MTPNDGRQTILARLSATPTLGHPAFFSAHLEAVSTTNWPIETLVARFVQALERLGATWEDADSAVVARLTLATRLQDEGVQRILTWTADQLPVGGVLEALSGLGIETVTPALFAPSTRLRPQDMDVRRKQLLAIEPISVGLVGADAAFAATGTLVLNSGPGRPLLVSQLPRRLIVLLPISRLYPSAERWLAGLPRVPGRQLAPTRVATLLTGPSRSVDIEVTPAYGVHGPSRLHVIVVRGK